MHECVGDERLFSEQPENRNSCSSHQTPFLGAIKCYPERAVADVGCNHSSKDDGDIYHSSGHTDVGGKRSSWTIPVHEAG
ncbi:MAG: hypothetical protein WCV69_02855 [Patescibacteria group bacterium]